MATLGVVYRYVLSMAKTFMGRFERDFELRNVVLRLETGDEEITAEMVAALANRDLEPIHEMLSVKMEEEGANWGKILCTYTYKSTGPYSYYISERNPSFPPVFNEVDSIIPPDKTIILAERGENMDDVTEQILPFLGPDGTFHGMVDFEDDDWTRFDIKSVLPDIQRDEQVELTFADGHSATLTSQQQEEIDDEVI